MNHGKHRRNITMDTVVTLFFQVQIDKSSRNIKIWYIIMNIRKNLVLKYKLMNPRKRRRNVTLDTKVILLFSSTN